jgi:hypothetical protein
MGLAVSELLLCQGDEMKKIVLLSVVLIVGAIAMAILNVALGINAGIGRFGISGEAVHIVAYMLWGAILAAVLRDKQ